MPPGGYAANGNLLAHSDSVMGDWAFQYDTLNRLTVMAPPPNSPNAPSADSISLGCYAYDAFGNRTLDVLTHSADDLCSSHPASEYSSYTTHNQTATVYEVTDSSGTDTVTSVPLTYDAAGNVTSDGSNAYVYDAEGRICAVENLLATTVTAYYYDASGTRVAKGTPASATLPLSSQACNPATNGFALTNEYLLDQAGNQVTELNNQVTGTAAMGWAHSNVWSGAHLSATYDMDDECNQTTGVCTWTPALHFHLSDPLGTRRVQIAPYGTTTYGMIEGFFQSLPYGDTLAVTLWDPYSGYTLPSADDATEHHFTGKERDAESGNDYFGARYYASSMGRWMSPDWAAKAMPVPYAKLDNPQSLNLYAYVLNNPLRSFDPEGHEMNAANPCNGAQNCTSSDTLKQVDTTFNKKDGSTTVTEVHDIVATVNNADGTSTRASGTVTTSITFDSAGKTTSASQSQSSTLVESFSKRDGQGGSTIGFTSATANHSVDTNSAFAALGGGNTAMGKLTTTLDLEGNAAEVHQHNVDKEKENQGEKYLDNLKDAVDILNGIKEALKPE